RDATITAPAPMSAPTASSGAATTPTPAAVSRLRRGCRRTNSPTRCTADGCASPRSAASGPDSPVAAPLPVPCSVRLSGSLVVFGSMHASTCSRRAARPRLLDRAALEGHEGPEAPPRQVEPGRRRHLAGARDVDRAGGEEPDREQHAEVGGAACLAQDLAVEGAEQARQLAGDRAGHRRAALRLRRSGRAVSL